ncbi:MAG: hypothetical protein R2792_02050 [Saprospiraceae bacterium]
MRVLIHTLSIAFILFFLAPQSLIGKPQEVRTGIYLMNLYDLNMNEHSFCADFYIWFKWKGEINPCEIEFVNSIEKWDMHFETSGDGSDSLLSDGSNYRIFRVEGRFFHSYKLNRFPLDRHQLDIQIEHPEFDSSELVFVPDRNGANMRTTLNLVGWDTRNCVLESSVHDYVTDFGNPDENARFYSNLSFNVLLVRPISYFILKMMLPLFIVMLVSIGALLLHPNYIDTRSNLPIGGLLTAVFLHQSYGDALPDIGYMVLMDKIYLLAYLIISLVLLQVIRAGNRVLMEYEVAPIQRFERWLARGYALLFALGVLALCWYH